MRRRRYCNAAPCMQCMFAGLGGQAASWQWPTALQYHDQDTFEAHRARRRSSALRRHPKRLRRPSLYASQYIVPAIGVLLGTLGRAGLLVALWYIRACHIRVWRNRNFTGHPPHPFAGETIHQAPFSCKEAHPTCGCAEQRMCLTSCRSSQRCHRVQPVERSARSCKQ